MTTKKRNKSYKPKQTSVPMLINRLVHENVETLEENVIILAFRSGFATKEHYDNLVKMANMMNIASTTKPCVESKGLKYWLNYMAMEILKRYEKTGKFGLSGTDLGVLKKIVEVYDLYWKRQTTAFYNECIAELLAFYEDVKESMAAWIIETKN